MYLGIRKASKCYTSLEYDRGWRWAVGDFWKGFKPKNGNFGLSVIV